MTVFRPARWAASTFSRMPPMGSTWPVRVISPVIATSSDTGCPRASDTSAVAIVMPADGPSFGTAPAGTWMCTSFPSNESRSRPSSPVAADPGEGGLRRLAHHVAELAGHDQLALAGHGARLDEEDVAAHGGEREAGGDAGIGRALARLRLELAPAEPGAHAPLVDAARFSLLPSAISRPPSADRCDLALEVAHAGLAGVLADDEPQRLVGEGELLPRSGRAPRAASARGSFRAMPSFSSSV